MSLVSLIKRSIIKGYKLEAKFLEECNISESLMSIFGDRSYVTKNFLKSGVKYYFNGENIPNKLKLLNPFVAYGKILYRIRNPDLVKKTNRLRNSFEDFHETYGLRLENI